MGLLGQRAEGSWIQVRMLEQPESEVGGEDREFGSGGLCPAQPSPALGAKGQGVCRQEAGWTPPQQHGGQQRGCMQPWCAPLSRGLRWELDAAL